MLDLDMLDLESRPSRWSVSCRRAQPHRSRLRERHGWIIDTWLLRRDVAEGLGRSDHQTWTTSISNYRRTPPAAPVPD